MKRKAFNAPGAVAVGPYSHSVDSEGLLFLSGQTPMNPQTGKLSEGNISNQTEQCFKNLFSVLESAGLTPDNVVKVNVFLVNMDHFSEMNEVYSKQFSTPYPARTTIGVASLPLGALIEIEMIARRK